MGTSISSTPPTVTATADPEPISRGDWGETFRLLSPLVIEMARKAGLTGDDQREVVQRVGLLLAEKLDELDRGKGTLRSWGAGFARNIVLQMKRSLDVERRRREPNVSVNELPATTLTAEQTLRARQALWILHAAVREEDRAVFELDALGATAVEIGEQLGMPTAMVEWRLKEARKRLVRGLARMREDRAEATRVRGVLWPFAATMDFAHHAPARPPGDGRGSEERRLESLLSMGRAYFVRRAARLLRTARAALGGERAPDTSRAVRRLRAALLVLVPALLSVHLVVREPELLGALLSEREAAGPSEEPTLSTSPRSADSADPTPLGATVVASAPTAPATVTTAVLAAVPIVAPASSAAPGRTGHPATAPSSSSSRSFGGRRWMEYRTIVGAWRKQQRVPSTAATTERP